MTELTIRPTEVPGLLIVDLPLHGDARGWFKENWQREKMIALGLPDFSPVQNNMSFNATAGSTRGLHAEPWDKLVSLATGRIFGAWVDLRPGGSFGRSVTLELGPETAVFVPRGVANGYQALEPGTVYSYLVNEHWSPEARASYAYVNLADPTVAIPWPIPLADAEISDADREHPMLEQAAVVAPERTVVLGASGQLGRALLERLPEALALTRADVDLSDQDSLDAMDWSTVGTIINAAAYTNVDAAETPEGRRECWEINVNGVRRLVEIARRRRIRLVHISSDYVFDGYTEVHTEEEPVSPLGVYGQTKAAGEALVATLPHHLIIRTSWVIGQGRNFVSTMADLAARGVNPSVVNDQFGRLTFAEDLAAGVIHLIDMDAAPGIYNLTNAGPTQSWADIARRVFELKGRCGRDVAEVSTDVYGMGKQLAPRPRHSSLSLEKLRSAGFTPEHADTRLIAYLESITPHQP